MEFLPIEKNGLKVYAGFQKRLGAALVDLLVFIPVLYVIFRLEGISISLAIICAVIANLIFSIYTIYFHYRFGATIGKMATGIKVTLPNGSAIGIKQALLRSSVNLIFLNIYNHC